MNFLEAVVKASTGKVIRRKGWKTEGGLKLIPMLGCHKLFWAGANVASGEESKILGKDDTLDLTSADLTAEDWELCS